MMLGGSAEAPCPEMMTTGDFLKYTFLGTPLA